jgi:hypothetical protein
LHDGRRNADVRLYAFDLLADDGVDIATRRCNSASYGWARSFRSVGTPAIRPVHARIGLR